MHTICVVVMALASVDVRKTEWKKYANKNYGRHDFQIELVMDIINYATEKEWDRESKRTGWMRQKQFVACNCEECYFCQNGFTTSISHIKKKRKLVLHCMSGHTIQTNKCAEVRVDIGKHANYCKMCYIKQLDATKENGKKLTAPEKKKKCNYTRMGFPQPSCNENICGYFGPRDKINISEKRLKIDYH